MADASPSSPRVVSRFEANLIRILRFFVKQVPAEQAFRLINEKMERPRCLSSSAVHLVKDSLAKGIILYLVRAGAWKRDRYLRGDTPRFGRLWERSSTEDLKLTFSRHVLDFLGWVTAHRPKDERPVWRTEEQNLTSADRLFFFLVYDAMRSEPEQSTALLHSPVFSNNALIWLAHPNDFSNAREGDLPSFDPWLTGPGTLLLEALQPMLERRWLEIERTKGTIGDWALLGQQGRNQARILEAFLNRANEVGRRDVVRFVMATLSTVLSAPDMSSTFWTGGLQGSGPPRLADRTEVQRNALAVLRQAGRLRQWEQSARRSGFMDEDYATSKFWLSEWERFNMSAVADRAERVLQQVEPLRIA